MSQTTTGIAGLATTAIVLLLITLVPSNASRTDPPTFSVAAAPSNLKPGGSTNIVAAVNHGTPKCTYSVTISVTPPSPGVVTSKTTSLTTNSAGNGLVSVVYPTAFPSGSSTAAAGTYTVTATFTCHYTGGSATTTFTVTQPTTTTTRSTTTRSTTTRSTTSTTRRR